MNKLIDLERDKSACNFEFTLELAHNTMKSLLRVINHQIFINADLICFVVMMITVLMITSAMTITHI